MPCGRLVGATRQGAPQPDYFKEVLWTLFCFMNGLYFVASRTKKPKKKKKKLTGSPKFNVIRENYIVSNLLRVVVVDPSLDTVELDVR